MKRAIGSLKIRDPTFTDASLSSLTAGDETSAAMERVSSLISFIG